MSIDELGPASKEEVAQATDPEPDRTYEEYLDIEEAAGGDFSIQTASADRIGDGVVPTQAITALASMAMPTATSGSALAAAETQQPIPPPPPPSPSSSPDRDGKNPGAVDGECRLLGPFALFVQAGLGLLAISSLLFKRYRERPRRPFKIFFLDASKQVMGSALLHVLNILMSIFTTSDSNLAHKAQELSAQLQNVKTQQVNPCSWYLINIAIDVSGSCITRDSFGKAD